MTLVVATTDPGSHDCTSRRPPPERILTELTVTSSFFSASLSRAFFGAFFRRITLDIVLSTCFDLKL
jgi:hypothetical protein